MAVSAGSAGSAGSLGSAGLESAEAQQLADTIAKFWWAWLVTGILWIAASVVILQFDHRSANLVGIIIGIMFIVAALQEFVAALMTPNGWKWMWAAFGVFLLGGGIWALFNPVRTFVAMADIVGFLFLLVGVGWTIQGFVTLRSTPLAWLGIVSGFIMIGIGFWAATQLFVAQVYILLMFAGIWAVLHGITDIIKSFMIHQAGKETFA